MERSRRKNSIGKLGEICGKFPLISPTIRFINCISVSTLDGDMPVLMSSRPLHCHFEHGREISIILIHSLILLYQCQELLKPPYSIFFQLPCIQQLPLLLHPIQHQVLFFFPFLILRHNVLFRSLDYARDDRRGLGMTREGSRNDRASE